MSPSLGISNLRTVAHNTFVCEPELGKHRPDIWSNFVPGAMVLFNLGRGRIKGIV